MISCYLIVDLFCHISEKDISLTALSFNGHVYQARHAHGGKHEERLVAPCACDAEGVRLDALAVRDGGTGFVAAPAAALAEAPAAHPPARARKRARAPKQTEPTAAGSTRPARAK